MKDHTVLELLEILSSSRSGIDALTTQVAIFGVLQHVNLAFVEKGVQGHGSSQQERP
jgi:hypothetical protein